MRHQEQEAVEVPEVKIANPDEIVIDDEEDFDDDSGVKEEEKSALAASAGTEQAVVDENAQVVPPEHLGAAETRFLALDKCLPRRQFLEVRFFFAVLPVLPF